MSSTMLVVVWKRLDFRESSRLVTLISRERGRFTALAKGAHRPNSAQLGRLDLLNRCEVQIAGRGIPLLGRTRLVHEPRALRETPRFLVASHLCEVLDRVFVPDRADSELFDLLVGATTLAERTPRERLPIVILGVELRLLSVLGQLGDLESCAVCGGEPARFTSSEEPGVVCSRHRVGAARALSDRALLWLRTLASSPGRTWPSRAPDRGLGEALATTERWTAHALELRPSHRRLALEHCRPS